MHKETDTVPGINKREKPEGFCFIMKEWKNSIPENEYKLIIANALNAMQQDSKPAPEANYITGYLVNPDAVYLLMNTIESKENTIHLFKQKLREAIIRFLEYIKSKRPGENTAVESLQNATIDEEQLFTCYPINNWYLVKLITGKKIEQDYYDPELTELKEKIKYNNF